MAYRFKARSATPGDYNFKAGALAFLPAAGDVDYGVGRGDGTTGTLVQPSEDDVELGVQYGAGGTEYTGTLVAGGSSSIDAPTLTVADQADGTGATATITGATAGTTNTVYTAAWPLSTFASSGSRVGNGTVDLSLSTGPYLAYVLSDLSGVQALSNLVQFRATGGTLSVHEQCLEAVRDMISALSLTDITDTDVIVQKFAWNTTPATITEGIFVCPSGEINQPTSNQRNTVIYPVLVVFVAKSNRVLTTGLSRMLTWREQVRRAADSAPTATNAIVAAVSELYRCEVQPGECFNWTGFGAMWDIGFLTIRCMAREPLTVT